MRSREVKGKNKLKRKTTQTWNLTKRVRVRSALHKDKRYAYQKKKKKEFCWNNWTRYRCFALKTKIQIEYVCFDELNKNVHFRFVFKFLFVGRRKILQKVESNKCRAPKKLKHMFKGVYFLINNIQVFLNCLYVYIKTCSVQWSCRRRCKMKRYTVG